METEKEEFTGLPGRGGRAPDGVERMRSSHVREQGAGIPGTERHGGTRVGVSWEQEVVQPGSRPFNQSLIKKCNKVYSYLVLPQFSETSQNKCNAFLFSTYEFPSIWTYIAKPPKHTFKNNHLFSNLKNPVWPIWANGLWLSPLELDPNCPAEGIQHWEELAYGGGC